MIPDIEVALHQLASFKGMLEAMRLHLTDVARSLISTVSEIYEHRIGALQEEIRNYLLEREKQSVSGHLGVI